MSGERIRILIADDHAVLRAGLRMLLEAQPDMTVVGEAADGEETIALTERLAPDLVLLDITMPGVGGLEALRQIKTAHPDTKVLVLTMHDDEGYLRQVLEAGGSGYVLKRAADTELLSAIRAVHTGGTFLHAEHIRILLESAPDREGEQQEEGDDSYERLSQREREVLRLIALGYTNRQAAEQLYLSVKTVETYKARLMSKLGLHSRAELVRYALRKGLLSE